MLDTNNFVEPSTGGIYNGFSSYEDQAKNISSHRISRWRNHLSKENHQLVDFLCGPEMKLAGYEPDFIFEDFNALGDIVPAIENDLKREVKWRCDLRDFKNDLGCELLRYSLIKSSRIDSHNLIEQNFLFSEIFEMILHNQK